MQVSFWPNVAAPARSQRWLNSLDAKCFPSRDFFPFSALASFASAASMTSLRRWPFDPVRTFPKMKCPRKNTEQLFFSSRTDTSESTKHRIRLWWICWQHTVASDTSKSNSTLCSKLWVLIKACKWVYCVLDVSVSVDSMQHLKHTSKTLHQSRIQCSVLSMVSVHDLFSSKKFISSV